MTLHRKIKSNFIISSNSGEEKEIDLDKIVPKAREEIEATINKPNNKPNFLDSYFKDAQPKLEQHYLSLYLLQSYNTRHSSELGTNDIILIEQYASDLLDIKKHHLLQTNDLFDDPPLTKALAIIYLAFKQPEQFQLTEGLDPSKTAQVKDHIEFANLYISQLSPKEITQLSTWINGNKGLKDRLPEPIERAIQEREKAPEMLKHVLDEAFTTDNFFARDIKALINHFYDANGNLKDENEFLTDKKRRLTPEERVLLEYFLEPYRILVNSHLNTAPIPQNSSEAMQHMADVFCNNEQYVDAFKKCTLNQSDFQAFFAGLGQNAIKPAQVLSEAELSQTTVHEGHKATSIQQVGALIIKPFQRIGKIPLLAIGMQKFANQSDIANAQSIFRISTGILDGLEAKTKQEDIDKIGKITTDTLYKSLSEKINEMENGKIKKAMGALNDFLNSADKDKKNSAAIEAIRSIMKKIEAYGLNQPKEIGILRKNKVKEILTDLTRCTTLKEMNDYLVTKIENDPELKRHLHGTLHKGKETTLITYLKELMITLQQGPTIVPLSETAHGVSTKTPTDTTPETHAPQKTPESSYEAQLKTLLYVMQDMSRELSKIQSQLETITHTLEKREAMMGHINHSMFAEQHMHHPTAILVPKGKEKEKEKDEGEGEGEGMHSHQTK